MFSGNPAVQICQYCWSRAFYNSSIRFPIFDNIHFDTKIMFLGQLDEKLCVKQVNLATLVYKSGNTVDRAILQ